MGEFALAILALSLELTHLLHPMQTRLHLLVHGNCIGVVALPMAG